MSLGQALRVLPVGTGYAVWTGIGTLGAAAVGIMILGEPKVAWRVISILLIAVGIVGLRLTAGAPQPG